MAQIKAEPKNKKIQKTIQFEPEAWAAIEAHMKRERINNISIAVNDAVKFGLFPEYRDDRNADLVKLYHQVSFSLAEHRKKTGRDLMLLQEFTLQFMKQFLIHTNEIPKGNQEAAEAQAQVRMDKIMESVIQSLPQAKALSEDA